MTAARARVTARAYASRCSGHAATGGPTAKSARSSSARTSASGGSSRPAMDDGQLGAARQAGGHLAGHGRAAAGPGGLEAGLQVAPHGVLAPGERPPAGGDRRCHRALRNEQGEDERREPDAGPAADPAAPDQRDRKGAIGRHRCAHATARVGRTQPLESSGELAARGVHPLPARRAQPVAAHAARLRARGRRFVDFAGGRDGVRAGRATSRRRPCGRTSPTSTRAPRQGVGAAGAGGAAHLHALPRPRRGGRGQPGAGGADAARAEAAPRRGHRTRPRASCSRRSPPPRRAAATAPRSSCSTPPGCASRAGRPRPRRRRPRRGGSCG